MKISHSIKNVSGEDIIYIYITVNDIYEFAKENLGKGENTNFLKGLKTYVSQNIKGTKKAAAVLVINGVIIGTLTLASLFPKTNIDEVKDGNYLKENIQVYTEQNTTKKEDENTAKVEDESKEDKAQETSNNQEKDAKKEVEEGDVKNTSSKVQNTTNKQTSQKNSTTTTSKKQTTTTNTTKRSSTKKQTTTTTTTKKTTTSSTSNTSATSNSTNNTNTSTSSTNNTGSSTSSSSSTTTQISSGTTIRFNNGGVISDIDLEEYVIGVVAAEMPASFSLEALKAQAVTARTYAMKKHSKGITLVNSTSHQVYYSETQMKSLWGSSYTTYYNKIKNAVNSTKGQVLKYGSDYIEALFYAISNGKSEFPKYVWNYSYPYLQAVSSSWDEGISAGKYSINMTYEKMSEKLGITVTKNSEIKIISRTAGDRVDKINIAGKTFSGVEIRTKLGLRSADFSIKQNDSNVTISTIGFGHGVGMSQYGANGAAKAGLTYRQILSHYYPGTSLVAI